MVIFTICICVIGLCAIGLWIYCIRLLDDVKHYENMSDLYFKMYFEIKKKYEEDEKILDNIKSSLPF